MFRTVRKITKKGIISGSRINTVPKFDVYSEERSIGIRWKEYVAKLENLFVGLKVDSKKRKKSTFVVFILEMMFLR